METWYSPCYRMDHPVGSRRDAFCQIRCDEDEKIILLGALRRRQCGNYQFDVLKSRRCCFFYNWRLTLWYFFLFFITITIIILPCPSRLYCAGFLSGSNGARVRCDDRKSTGGYTHAPVLRGQKLRRTFENKLIRQASASIYFYPHTRYIPTRSYVGALGDKDRYV